MDLSELRGEFVDQVYKLRSKILQEVRIKQVGGEEIDGKIWISLLSQYVNAINVGDIPDIQNSWHYICQEVGRGVVATC